jgi:hypothetical protein
MEGRHVGLDFYDLLIEVIWRFVVTIRIVVFGLLTVQKTSFIVSAARQGSSAPPRIVR